MAVQLARRPGLNVPWRDDDAARTWIRDHVGEEILTRGEPHPKIYLLGTDFVETLDIDAMLRKEVGAHVGLTFQLLRRRDHVERCFLVMGVQGKDIETQRDRYWALVFEERDTSDGRAWWMAMVEYHNDAHSGLGRPVGDWVDSGETHNPRALPPFLVEIASPPPGSRPADIRDAGSVWMPDMKFAFGDLPPQVDPPKDAKQMVEMAASLAAKDLLDGTIQGSVVVRIVGRSWEQWVLSGDLPATIGEMIRWIANHRLPAAEGVALAHIAVKSSDDPPAPGLQVIGELGDFLVETWAPLQFPEGPSGPKLMPEVRWWPARRVDPDQRWLGVASSVDLEHGGPVG